VGVAGWEKLHTGIAHGDTGGFQLHYSLLVPATPLWTVEGLRCWEELHFTNVDPGGLLAIRYVTAVECLQLVCNPVVDRGGVVGLGRAAFHQRGPWRLLAIH